jgi:L-gulonolactone oxidase
MPTKLQNWKRVITYYANSVEKVTSIEQIQSIVRDKARYPSPVRAKGSHHSTTRCVVNENGTVIEMTGLNKILKIDKEARTITMQAGVFHIDAAKALEKNGLQFYVNCEIGNLTTGSGACCATKDASYFGTDSGEWEYGQCSSYCIAAKLVGHDGEIFEVSEAEDPGLMEAVRSSYGMFGILVEVTYRVKPISGMMVKHVTYDVKDFVADLDALVAQKKSIMLYLFPFLDRVVVEYRYDVPERVEPGSWQWAARNYTWKTLWPFMSKVLHYGMPIRSLRFRIINLLNRLTTWVMSSLIKDRNSSPADQIIRYPETAGFASYTFSIWAFPRERYGAALLAYFAFCKQYYKDNGFRCDMLNVGYHIIQDRQALFSYTRRGPVLTFDPVATGMPGFEGFLVAYNEFCSRLDGRPLLNQTGSLTPYQVQKAFREEIPIFLDYRRRLDPEDRFYTPHFRALFEEAI